MQTILSVIGTRPEAVKMAPIVQALARQPQRVLSIVCVTGQHREQLDQVLHAFDIVPDYDLNLMQPNQSLSTLTARLLEGLSAVAGEVRPDWVLAQGDTTTVMVAGLVAYYQRLRFGHVEAGLRTGDKFQPFPEEINRRMADLLADACFAPTETARAALLAEGIDPARVFVTGNTVVDALQTMAERPYRGDALPIFEVGERVVLVTAHRRESFGAPLRSILQGVRALALRYPTLRFVYPVHLNPNVQAPAREILSGLDNVHLLPPLEYPALVHLMQRAVIILTDSGGIQEEAPAFGVPLLVLRDKTERPEGIAAGVARLVGTDAARIEAEAARLLDDEAARQAMRAANPYGDGQAAARIVAHLLGDAFTESHP